MAARERAQRVETARDRADKAAFTLAVGRDRAEHRRHGLVGAVGATEALDRDVGAPSGFEQEVDAPLARGRAVQVSVVGPPRATRLGKDEDGLSPRHEVVGLGDVGTGRATLDLLPALPINDNPPRAPRDLGNHVGAEMYDEKVERSRNRRHRAEPLDQIVARGDRFLAQDTVAVVIEHWLGAH